MKKFSAFFMSFLAAVCISSTALNYTEYSFAAESETQILDGTDHEKEPEEKESKAPVIITVVIVFTVTSAATAIATYKKKTKSRK